jgi:hypothetical protein
MRQTWRVILGFSKTGWHRQQAGHAGAVAPEQPVDPAAFEGEDEVVQGGHLPIAEPQARHLDVEGHRSPSLARCRILAMTSVTGMPTALASATIGSTTSEKKVSRRRAGRASRAVEGRRPATSAR